MQCSDKVNDVPVVQVVVRVSWKVPQIQFIARAGGHFRSQQRRARFQRMVAVNGFSAVFRIFRAPLGCPGVERQFPQLGSPR